MSSSTTTVAVLPLKTKTVAKTPSPVPKTTRKIVTQASSTPKHQEELDFEKDRGQPEVELEASSRPLSSLRIQTILQAVSHRLQLDSFVLLIGKETFSAAMKGVKAAPDSLVAAFCVEVISQIALESGDISFASRLDQLPMPASVCHLSNKYHFFAATTIALPHAPPDITTVLCVLSEDEMAFTPEQRGFFLDASEAVTHYFLPREKHLFIDVVSKGNTISTTAACFSQSPLANIPIPQHAHDSLTSPLPPPLIDSAALSPLSLPSVPSSPLVPVSPGSLLSSTHHLSAAGLMSHVLNGCDTPPTANTTSNASIETKVVDTHALVLNPISNTLVATVPQVLA